ncbi:MAG: mechanosensitive ion channel domain-containing protein, partial [Pseudomonadota bacterium]
ATDEAVQAEEVTLDLAGDAQAAIDFFSPENLMNLGQLALPYAVQGVIALLILWIGFKVARWVGSLAQRNLVKAPNVDATLAKFLGSLVRYALMAFVVIAAVDRIGIQIAGLLAIFGAAGLAIGLALQGTLSNIAAGVMLMLFRPFKIGDYVRVAGEEGVVSDLNIFTTELKTVDNIHVIIGNGDIFGTTIQNLTSLGVRRVDNDFGIDYEDDIDKAIKIITETAAKHPKVLTEPAGPWAKVVGLGDSSVNIQSRVWSKSEDYWDVMFDLNKSVKEAFDKGGITIPYPISVELDSK